ncbi:MAG: hypothetical protein LIO62_02800, partial [Clostridiales bacterium]|nr:hypothetical protein [Clostridiales bacterium]
EFELLTAIMFKYFEDEKVDFAVVECGMGGKDDSTNVISSPILEIITSVSMDHTDFLGDTLEKIAEQKAGIIKSESAVVLYPNKSVNHIFEDYAKKVNAKVISVGENGDYQKNNLALVNTALKYLNFSPVEIGVKLGARQELIGENIMLDGAHNVGGALALEKNLPKNREITAVIGMMRDKDVNSYLKIISAHCRRIIATQPSYYRAMTAEDLADAARKYCGDVTVVKNPHDAVKIKDYDFLLVCGSFYLARDVRKELL